MTTYYVKLEISDGCAIAETFLQVDSDKSLLDVTKQVIAEYLSSSPLPSTNEYEQDYRKNAAAWSAIEGDIKAYDGALAYVDGESFTVVALSKAQGAVVADLLNEELGQ